ncbi:hypothetical protein ACQU0X_28640 [Pseudovibrio ascidiaceicola]|uniref:hypothetical protein n=1 Tax=Pseudovibrio ascidiaceicola TaxID=285279 RepID=UPI003D360A91
MTSRTSEAKVEVGLVDRFTRPMKKIDKSIERLNAPFKRLNKSVGNFVKTARFDRVGNAAAKLGRQLKTLSISAGALGTAAALGTTALVKSFSDQSRVLSELSRNTGFDVEKLQEWEFVAKRAGIEQEQFNDIIKEFGIRLGEARGKEGPLYDFLEERGKPGVLKKLLEFQDQAEAFEYIVNELSTINDDSLRLFAAGEIFGGAGEEFGAVIKQGPKANKQLREMAREMGFVLGADKIEGGNQLARSFTDLQSTFSGLAKVISAELAPSLKTILDTLGKLIKDNMPAIKAWAKDFGEKLPKRIDDIIKGFKEWGKKLESFKSTIETVTGPISNLELAIGAIATITLAPVITSMVQLTALLGRSAVILSGGLIAGLVGLSKKSDTVIPEVTKSTGKMRRGFNRVGSSVSRLNTKLGKVAKHAKALTTAGGLLSKTGALATLSLGYAAWETGQMTARKEGETDDEYKRRIPLEMQQRGDALNKWAEDIPGLSWMVDKGFLKSQEQIEADRKKPKKPTPPPQPQPAEGSNAKYLPRFIGSLEPANLSPPQPTETNIDASVGSISVVVTPQPGANAAQAGREIGAGIANVLQERRAKAAELTDN